jgi:hypothetical protein
MRSKPPFFVIISSISDFSLQYDQPLNLLRVEWASGDDMRTFRVSAEQLLLLCQQLQVRHMLLNMNTLPDISVYDQVWMSAHWMPAVVQSSLERVVLVNHRRRVHNQLAIESLLAQVSATITFDIQYFPQPGSGLHWLTDYSDRLPALLSEWQAVHGPSVPPAPGVSEPRPQYRPLDS